MKVLILAAGKGSRLNSKDHILPKVLRKAKGQALISYVLEALDFIKEEDTTIVVGFKGELVKEHLGGSYRYVEQTEQLGTGHAVKVTEEELKSYDGPVLVVYGDMPLFKKESYEELMRIHQESGNACTLLSAEVERPLAYGRIIRQNDEALLGIIEEKDCTEEQKKIKELNVGVYAFDSKKLFDYLGSIKNNNAQSEYYLTDVPKAMIDNQEKVAALKLHDTDEIYGVNTVEELAFVERILEERRTI